jgi:putative ABC transport system substrate-binding protein
MKRRQFLGVLATAIAAPRSAFAQKTPVIGLLWNDSVKPSPYVAVLEAALKERGYVRGRNLRLEDAVALEGYGPMAPNAARLAAAKVDVIVSYGATATLAAAKATDSIPIVAIVGSDPVQVGLAASLARPGRNVTGVWTLATGLNRKRVELLKEVVPRLSRAGVLYAPGSTAQLAVAEADAAARTLKIAMTRSEVRSADEIDEAIARLARAHVEGIFIGTSTLLASHAERVVAGVAKHRIPAVYGTERYIDPGGLVVYAPSIRRAFDHVAVYVDRILRGGKPGDMPIEQVSDVELVVNLKTARLQGIKLPQAILQRADRAIQ